MSGLKKFKGTGPVTGTLNKIRTMLIGMLVGGRGINVVRTGDKIVIELRDEARGGVSVQKDPYWVPYADE